MAAATGWTLAALTPVNTFSVGKTQLNRKKGTATLSFEVPNAGELTGSGKGAKVASGARSSKAVQARTATLLVKAKGKKKRKLNDRRQLHRRHHLHADRRRPKHSVGDGGAEEEGLRFIPVWREAALTSELDEARRALSRFAAAAWACVVLSEGAGRGLKEPPDRSP